jgi:Protein of unknown function (DUF1116)
MAGVVSPSMPVWVVVDAASGRRSFSALNEGLGKVWRFGAHDQSVIERLKWMCAMNWPPGLDSAVRNAGPIALKPIVAQALHG